MSDLGKAGRYGEGVVVVVPDEAGRSEAAAAAMAADSDSGEAGGDGGSVVVVVVVPDKARRSEAAAAAAAAVAAVSDSSKAERDGKTAASANSDSGVENSKIDASFFGRPKPKRHLSATKIIENGRKLLLLPYHNEINNIHS